MSAALDAHAIVTRYYSDPYHYVTDILGATPDKWQADVLHSVVQERRVAVSSGHGIGKALSLDTPIPTPDGFVPMGSLKKGDTVFGQDGAPTRVMGYFPQGKVPAYRVTFSDGSSVVACGDHQWSVRGRQQRRCGEGWVTMTTRQILDKGVMRPNGKGEARQWEIPRQGPAQFSSQPVPVEPYTFGVWLGDGNNGSGVVTGMDEEVWKRVGTSYEFGRPQSSGKATSQTVLGIKPLLAKMGVLHNKHVPACYKINSPEVRLSVLRGLMDTDGECAKHGSSVFNSTTKQLAEDVVWLARSLGAVAKMQPTVKQTGHKPCYRVTVTADFPLFEIERKRSRQQIQPEGRYLRRWIQSIEPVEPVEMACIAVSNTDRRYLCGEDFIVTHNTCLSAWIIHWFIATRFEPEIIVTANTKNQLDGKTWRELAKWNHRALNGEMFQWTATKFFLKEAPETWFAHSVPWSEARADAFAGTHEKHVLMLFDEASGIADKIWETAEGAMTTPGSKWLAFGNPTRNTGRFAECFKRFRHRWMTMQIDSRTAKMADQSQIQQWIEDYGEDSDFVRVRVRGIFPRVGDSQFISHDLVATAAKREVFVPPGSPRLLGVDVARFGDDQSVITFRNGRKLERQLCFRELDTMALASKVANIISEHRPDAVMVDGVGVGSGVVDRLIQLGHPVLEVQGGSKPDHDNVDVYYNKRSEMWGRMREWLQTAQIPDERELHDDLTGPEFGFDTKMRLQLEKKEDMKKRGLASPDRADSLALTFAFPVAPVMVMQSSELVPEWAYDI